MIRLRQVALVAHDLEVVVGALHDELGLDVAYRDPGVATFGLVNAVLPLGSQFIEVVSPTREGTAGGRQLERMGGDGGYMVICHTDDQAPFKARAEALGIRSAIDVDDHGYRLWQLHPGDTGGSFLEIDFQPGWEETGGPWMPAGPSWHEHVRTDVVDAITGVELAAAPEVPARWRELLGVEHFDNAELRWSVGTRGILAVDVHATDRGRTGEVHTVGGVDFRFV